MMVPRGVRAPLLGIGVLADLTPSAVEARRRHEGLGLMTFDSSVPPGFAYCDAVLEALFERTSEAFRLGLALAGSRVVFYVRQRDGGGYYREFAVAERLCRLAWSVVPADTPGRESFEEAIAAARATHAQFLASPSSFHHLHPVQELPLPSRMLTFSDRRRGGAQGAAGRAAAERGAARLPPAVSPTTPVRTAPVTSDDAAIASPAVVPPATEAVATPPPPGSLASAWMATSAGRSPRTPTAPPSVAAPASPTSHPAPAPEGSFPADATAPQSASPPLHILRSPSSLGAERRGPPGFLKVCYTRATLYEHVPLLSRAGRGGVTAVASTLMTPRDSPASGAGGPPLATQLTVDDRPIDVLVSQFGAMDAGGSRQPDIATLMDVVHALPHQVRFPVVVFGIIQKTARSAVVADYGAAAYECTYPGLVRSLMQVLAAQGDRRARREGRPIDRRTLSGLDWPA